MITVEAANGWNFHQDCDVYDWVSCGWAWQLTCWFLAVNNGAWCWESDNRLHRSGTRGTRSHVEMTC